MSIIERDELYTLLPHKGEMFLLSRVIDYDKKTLVSEFDITKNCIFYDDELDGLPAWVSFELMAQGISAIAGIENRAKGLPVQLGFILSVTSMDLFASVLKCGSTARIEVEEDCRIDLVSTLACKVSVNGELVAKAKVSCIEADEYGIVKNNF
ncbi:MAG: hypothetical protein Ta2F_05160 [Termitinemataceae bacterium]|nr:MAG: hypothetical protein Ta2F_05160 [Termitinemataceae bacterium]